MSLSISQSNVDVPTDDITVPNSALYERRGIIEHRLLSGFRGRGPQKPTNGGRSTVTRIRTMPLIVEKVSHPHEVDRHCLSPVPAMLGIPFLDNAIWNWFKPQTFDDPVDRLNYFITSTLLTFFAIMLTSKFWVKMPV
ncbi:hypothetical protein NECAME_13684 [Necator americanus]|uniref:Uncharacterized protein n=1 Tax=Necator americanus TaxID=51031 RepID=W2STH1_NECAM|nr:hypothetical protein NECAME_13684 [Necator americanus]ETN72925.1 hypothetical protein NECAME_13684 [Necator americanus]